MIAAVEKQKFVYVLNRDNQANLTISSPLEAHRSHHIVFDIASLDVSFNNPVFAAIELDYDEADHDPSGKAIEESNKVLTFYELDLGLNHVVRKSSENIHRSAHRLITVPGGSDGPGGVLVCAKDQVIYRSFEEHPEVKSYIPRRMNTVATQYDGKEDKGVYIISHASHKMKDYFFFLIQTEYGDIFKVTLDFNKTEVKKINIKYFDTIAPSNSLCVLKSGFLFSASEVGNHYFYQFQSVGDDDEDVTIKQLNGDIGSSNDDDDDQMNTVVYFKPRPLKNLVIIDEIPSPAPILDVKIENLFKEETSQLLCLCGSGTRSSLRILRHGIAVNEIGQSGLKQNPTNVWAVKQRYDDENDKFIIVSFYDSTIVLSIGDTIEQLTESDPNYSMFEYNTATLNAGLLGTDTIVQIYSDGIRHIRSDKRIQEWKPPLGKKIVQSCFNERQVAIALNGGDIYYFELNQNQKLIEIEKLSTGREITSMSIEPLEENKLRSRFLAIGDIESKVRILSLDHSNCLQTKSHINAPSKPVSLSFIHMHAYGGNQLFLNIGTVDGIFLRTKVDHSGGLSDIRKKFLGVRPVKLFKIKINGKNALLLLSTRPWILYNYQDSLRINPLSYVPLEGASTFNSEQCSDGIICITKDKLRIFTPERIGEMFNQTEIKLRYTPRQSIILPFTKYMAIIESDHNAYSYDEINKDQNQSMDIEKEEEEEEEEEEAMPISQYGVPKPGPGKWASCIRIMDVVKAKTLDLIELKQNECAVSLCTVQFKDHNNDVFLCVGTVKDYKLLPKKSCTCGYINVYRIVDQGKKLELIEKKKVEDIPGAMTSYQDRLLVGIGSTLKLFDLGKIKHKLIRKCEYSPFPNQIVSLNVYGERIIVGDIQESFHFVIYNQSENVFYIFTDDTMPRWVTSCEPLDYNTVAGTDKFGNIFILRIPDKVAEVENDPTGSKLLFSESYLNGAPYKLESIAHFYVGEPVTRIRKATLTLGSPEFLLYTTINGTIGALIPFTSKNDVEFFTRLEMNMRQMNPPLCGRNHLVYRSYYSPVKNIVDGDLCEQFATMIIDYQNEIAEDLERSTIEVQKKIEETRDSI